MIEAESSAQGSSPAVLLITRNLPPLRGGMERLNLHLAHKLSEWGALTVIGPAGCREFLPDSATVIEVPVRPLWRFLLDARRAARRAASQRPALVFAGSGLTAVAARVAAKRCGAKSVAYVHGLDLTTRHSIYRALWVPALRRLDHAFANSANTADIALRLGVASGSVTVLHPGVTLPSDSASAGESFRYRHCLGNRPILLSVGRMMERKGLAEFVGQALPSIHARHPNVALVVIGDEAPDALGGRGEGAKQRIVAAAAEHGLQACIHFLGPCDDATLTQAYFAADAHVFPVRDIPGDVEGFGMVAIEAAAHGLPTVAFAVGGVPDAVSHGRSGYLAPPGDYALFADRVCELLNAGRNAPMRQTAKEVAQAFRWERFGERLLPELDPLLGRNGDTDDTEIERRGHAVLDLRSRDAKARKIEALLGLGLAPTGRPLRLLEVGAGSGGIAHYFANHPRIQCEVEAVDVSDTRQIQEGFRFTRVGDVRLPFPNDSFDVVISNHVIEHVGDDDAQRLHLHELRRVLRNDGVGYLAVPNRWQLVEPHYRIAFLSWLPPGWRTPYLRLRNRGREYDCRPLRVPELEAQLRAAGFDFAQQHGRALRLTYELERPRALAYRAMLRWVPDAAYAALRRIFPTLIYVLRSSDSGIGRMSAGSP